MLVVAFIIQIISVSISVYFPPTLSSTNMFILEVVEAEYQGRVGGGRKKANPQTKPKN